MTDEENKEFEEMMKSPVSKAYAFAKNDPNSIFCKPSSEIEKVAFPDKVIKLDNDDTINVVVGENKNK